MQDRPSGAELLWQARRVLLQDLLNELPEHKRYDGLMVAAAMAIAAREQEAGETPLRRQHAELVRLLDDPAKTPAESSALRDDLHRLCGRLAEAIRSGRADENPEIHAKLCDMAADQLRSSNPKALRNPIGD